MVERADPQTAWPGARRVWRVDIGPDPRRVTCSTRDCPGPPRPSGQTAQEATVGHLATHAQLETLADHLRTCRCHAHGCSWHPRHRGCTGPIVLTVFRQRHGRIWQLADTCTGCAHAIPHAALVPSPGRYDRRLEPSRTGTRTSRSGRHVDGHDHGECQSAVLAAVLHYLGAALGPQVPPAARILALACLLRADARGIARLPHGLLRSLRLAHHSDLLADHLAQEHWLLSTPDCADLPSCPPGSGLTVRMTDPAASVALAGASRPTRRHLFDQVLRLLTLHQVRVLDCGSRFAVLSLAVRTSSTQAAAAVPGALAHALAPQVTVPPPLPDTPAPSERRGPGT